MTRALNLKSLKHDLHTGRFEATFSDNGATITVEGGGASYDGATVADLRKMALDTVRSVATDLLACLPTIAGAH